MELVKYLKTGLELARVSKATYAGPINHLRYTYNGTPFDGQKIIHGAFGRGYCRVFWNESSVVIAFRGTRESIDWIVSNLKMLPTKLRDCPDARNIRVHRGFQRTLDFGDKTTDLRSLDAINDYLEEFELLNKKIAITGHSLGGALALLYAVKLRSRYPNECEKNLSKIVTFGAPAVGLKGFHQYYGELSKITTRFVNDSDAVPFTPPFFYCHVGKDIWLKNQGSTHNIKWPTRLRYAIGNSWLKLGSDHSMTEYIEALKRDIEKLDAENSQS